MSKGAVIEKKSSAIHAHRLRAQYLAISVTSEKDDFSDFLGVKKSYAQPLDLTDRGRGERENRDYFRRSRDPEPYRGGATSLFPTPIDIVLNIPAVCPRP